MNEGELVKRAKEYAYRLHLGQFINNKQKSPYTVHLEEVADLVTLSGGSEIEIAAAWLHDVVENTSTTIEEIEKEFGKEVAEIVYGLTDFPEFEKLPLKDRKEKQAERLINENISVRLVKLADQSSNVRIVGMRSLLDMDEKEALEYIDGAKKIAENCKGISLSLDAIFYERYNNALSHKNL